MISSFFIYALGPVVLYDANKIITPTVEAKKSAADLSLSFNYSSPPILQNIKINVIISVVDYLIYPMSYLYNTFTVAEKSIQIFPHEFLYMIERDHVEIII